MVVSKTFKSKYQFNSSIKDSSSCNSVISGLESYQIIIKANIHLFVIPLS